MLSLKERIIGNLTEDLLKPEFKGGEHFLAGHCYVASEAYYHLSDKQLKAKIIKHEGVNHWYLEDKDGKIIDLTAEQFSSCPDYSRGRGIGFLTKKPSKRTQILIKRIAG
jgi:hypothetical protein